MTGTLSAVTLSKGRAFEETLPLSAVAGIVPAEELEELRKLIIGTNHNNIRLIIVCATDVPTHMQCGMADSGIARRDVLIKHDGDGLYRPLDLRIASCRMMVAVKRGFDYTATSQSGNRLRITTKYLDIAAERFAGKGVHVDIIKLYGSVELTPLIGLSDAIVDLASSGNTLRVNGLEAAERMADISSRLVVNEAALKTKYILLNPTIQASENTAKAV